VKPLTRLEFLKVLAIGAHPDDVELGCGATLALLKKKKHEVSILVLSKGEASGDPRTRQEECCQSATTLGVDELYFGDLKDTKIDDGIDSIRVIETILDQTSSELVFGHSPKDRHQDHRNAGLASMSAARNVKSVLLYESPTALRDFCPQVFVDVTSTFDIKLKALDAFGPRTSEICFHCRGDQSASARANDEAEKLPVISNAIEGLARYRGFQAGIALSEAFEVGRLLMEFYEEPGRM
jgi:LmbE family N-acetylglucosaminyl deacetylase